jgi:hypothetical protein
MLTIQELKAYKAKARRQRDNWKRRATIYRTALELIADGTYPFNDAHLAETALRDAAAIAKAKGGAE